MDKETLKILIIEDNPYDAELEVKELESKGFILDWKRVETQKDFKKALKEKPDLILADYKLPSFSGPEALKIQQELAPNIPLIIITGTVGEEKVVECMKAGAKDYVLKDKLSRLVPVVKRALKEAEERRELIRSEEALKASNQQLSASEQQLRAANQQLSASEQQLRASNQQLIESEQVLKKEKVFSENLLGTANVFILNLDVNANITLFNKFAEKLTGYKREEVLGKNWFDLFIPKRSSSIIPDIFSSVLKGMPEFSSHDNQILCKNGSERLISWKNTVLQNENGEISGIISIGEDITERKQAEEALKENEQLNRTVIENSPVGISVREKNGTLLLSNRAWQKLWGHTEKDMQELQKQRMELEFDASDSYLGVHQADIQKVYEKGGTCFIPEIELKGIESIVCRDSSRLHFITPWQASSLLSELLKNDKLF